MHPSRPQTRTRGVALVGVALSAVLVASPIAASAQVPATVPHEVVAAAESSFQVPTGALVAGSTVRIEYATDSPDDTNWIGFYRDGEVPGGDGQVSVAWKYAPGASGSIDLEVPAAPGSYTLWFLAADGYEPLAEQQTVTVSAAGGELSPGDPAAAVDIESVTTGVATDGVLLREGFDAGLPESWSVESASTMD
ncbi:MAG: hypothetical protein K0S37_4634, partial [Microbacterium sp.]|nr:hypothetical protein [Microbacterium sp.]